MEGNRGGNLSEILQMMPAGVARRIRRVLTSIGKKIKKTDCGSGDETVHSEHGGVRLASSERKNLKIQRVKREFSFPVRIASESNVPPPQCCVVRAFPSGRSKWQDNFPRRLTIWSPPIV